MTVPVIKTGNYIFQSNLDGFFMVRKAVALQTGSRLWSSRILLWPIQNMILIGKVLVQ